MSRMGRSFQPILNLFYEVPEEDRWLPYDRFPRRLVRRIVRGPRQPSGHDRVFLNLCKGLDLLGIRYRVNDYQHALKHPDEVVGIIGKPFLLDKLNWANPIVFGAAGYSHPSEDPELPHRRPIRRILVPGEWSKKMFAKYWGDLVESWPTGIDTKLWAPSSTSNKSIDVLIYDKVRWKHEEYDSKLIEPIRTFLRQKRLTFTEIRYGEYKENDFRAALQECRAMVFLCEHETQGIAYQQALSSGLPIYSWDRGGFWQDPSFYPHSERFSAVTSVPYWDARCGEKFTDFSDFLGGWHHFWSNVLSNHFRPRDFVLEHLTLELCAKRYLDIINLHR